jgi:hypothetical protein
MRRRFAAICVIACLLGGAAPAALAAKAPATWDGLTLVKSKRFDAVYLAPDANFSGYRKVMLDPTEVAFRKNWVSDYNSTVMGLSTRLSQADADAILVRVRKGFEEIFRAAYVNAGQQVVSEPGPDVLRVRTAVANLFATSPVDPPGRGYHFAREAGGATLIIELRDSSSGALLGRAVDGKLAGDTGTYLRTEVGNRWDFKNLFQDWARRSLDGMAVLRGRTPTPAGAP